MDLFANLSTHLLSSDRSRTDEQERPGEWRLRGSGGLEIQLSGAGDRGGLEELLGVLHGQIRMVVAETEGGTVMAALQLEQYSKEREGKGI
jgi:hypothetical protein